MKLHGFPLSCALEWVWRLVLMKADGKSAKGGSDQIDKEDFWGSFWRKQRRFEEKDQRTVLEGGDNF
jgi:hypothetical protein